MKIRTTLLAAVSVFILASICVSASQRPRAEMEPFPAHPAGAAVAPEPAPVFRILQAAGSDEERGCCILPASPGEKCVSASRGFCRQKAAQAKIAFEFRANTACSSIPQCK
jgi:hypothetical protein